MHRYDHRRIQDVGHLLRLPRIDGISTSHRQENHVARSYGFYLFFAELMTQISQMSDPLSQDLKDRNLISASQRSSFRIVKTIHRGHFKWRLPCGLKVSNAASEAWSAAMLALENRGIRNTQGIISPDIHELGITLREFNEKIFSAADSVMIGLMTRQNRSAESRA